MMSDADGDNDGSLVHAIIKQTITLAAETSALTVALLKQLDLTEPLANVLWRLDPDGTAPSMSALAAALHCDPSTVTFLTDRLERRGLVQRHQAPTDRRQKIVSLTDRGAEVRRQLVHTVTTHSPLAQLSVAQQQDLSALLAKAGADPEQFVCRPVDPAAATGRGGQQS